MVKLAPISWKKFEKFVLFLGCKFKHQKGSHRIYIREGLNRPIVIPAYGEIPLFVIRNNLRLLGKTIEEYLEIKKEL